MPRLPSKWTKVRFAAGTYLVRMDQPYRSYAHDLLIAQKFPADTTPNTPYDDVGWALPFTLGVEVTAIEDAAVRDIETDLVTADVSHSGTVAGGSGFYLIKDTGQEALLAARHRLAEFDVEAAETSFTVDEAEYPAGSWIIADQQGLRPALEGVADSLGIDVVDRTLGAGRTPPQPRSSPIGATSDLGRHGVGGLVAHGLR